MSGTASFIVGVPMCHARRVTSAGIAANATKNILMTLANFLARKAAD
jgi:hypothetical protein